MIFVKRTVVYVLAYVTKARIVLISIKRGIGRYLLKCVYVFSIKVWKGASINVGIKKCGPSRVGDGRRRGCVSHKKRGETGGKCSSRSHFFPTVLLRATFHKFLVASAITHFIALVPQPAHHRYCSSPSALIAEIMRLIRRHAKMQRTLRT